MSRFLDIRRLLGMTQEEVAGVLGCSQWNGSFLDRGQTVRPETARKLVETAVALGVQLSLEQVYGDAPLPPWRSIANSQQLDRRDWREVLQQLMARGWTAPLLAARYGVKVSLIVDLTRGDELDPPHSVGHALLDLHETGKGPKAQKQTSGVHGSDGARKRLSDAIRPPVNESERTS